MQKTAKVQIEKLKSIPLDHDGLWRDVTPSPGFEPGSSVITLLSTNVITDSSTVGAKTWSERKVGWRDGGDGGGSSHASRLPRDDNDDVPNRRDRRTPDLRIRTPWWSVSQTSFPTTPSPLPPTRATNDASDCRALIKCHVLEVWSVILGSIPGPPMKNTRDQGSTPCTSAERLCSTSTRIV